MAKIYHDEVGYVWPKDADITPHFSCRQWYALLMAYADNEEQVTSSFFEELNFLTLFI